jgi:tetratricopeptide (TPR) repeat protein
MSQVHPKQQKNHIDITGILAIEIYDFDFLILVDSLVSDATEYLLRFLKLEEKDYADIPNLMNRIANLLKEWISNGFDTRLLPVEIAILLLGGLSSAGDPKAVRLYEEQFRDGLLHGTEETRLALLETSMHVIIEKFKWNLTDFKAAFDSFDPLASSGLWERYYKVLESRGDLFGAIAAIKEAVSLQRPKPHMAFELARILRRLLFMDRFKWSKADSENAFAPFPPLIRSDLWFKYSEALKICGDIDGAIEAIRESIRINETNIRIREELARLLRKTGDSVEADIKYEALDRKQE